jgi:hypothetical protein
MLEVNKYCEKPVAAPVLYKTNQQSKQHKMLYYVTYFANINNVTNIIILNPVLQEKV